MKRLKQSIILVVLIFSTTTTLCQNHQTTTTDSCTCIPNEKLRDGAQLIEKGQRDAALLNQANQEIYLLNQRIETKEEKIQQFQRDTVLYAAVISTYIAEVKNLQQQKATAVQAATDLDKAVRAAKRKTVFVVVAIVAVAIGIHLLIK